MTQTATVSLTTFPFECACGERYTTFRAADACRKCRTYIGTPHAAPIRLTGDARTDAGQARAVHALADAKAARQAARWEREAEAEREAFRAKVAALGLDPDRYMDLA